MTIQETLDKFLKAYQTYYTIESEKCLEPFAATATFSIHNEQYMLIKAAKYADINSNEYVYFFTSDDIDESNFARIKKIAWEDGISKVVPDTTHRNSDVTLIIICENIPKEIRKTLKKSREYKSYALGFKGWSNFRLVAIECSSGDVILNSQGQQLKKLVGNILLTYEKGEKS